MGRRRRSRAPRPTTVALKRAVKSFVEASLRRADLRSEQRLADAAAPRAARLFAKLSAASNGVLLLIQLRGDLITFLLDPLLAVTIRSDAAVTGTAASTVPGPERPSTSAATTATSALQVRSTFSARRTRMGHTAHRWWWWWWCVWGRSLCRRRVLPRLLRKRFFCLAVFWATIAGRPAELARIAAVVVPAAATQTATAAAAAAAMRGLDLAPGPLAVAVRAPAPQRPVAPALLSVAQTPQAPVVAHRCRCC